MTNTTNNPFEGSDRYQYQVDYTEPGVKTFTAGSVVRMSAADAAPLIEQGILKQVAPHTLCGENPLAPGGCAPIEGQELGDDLPATATATASNRFLLTKNKH